MYKKTFFLTTFAFLLSSLAAVADKKPNIVLMLVDDLGWMDLACQGSNYYETPHIDQLAADGIRFTNGYAACAVCSPSRASVQTGRYPHRTGVTDWIRSRFQGGKIPEDKANPCWKPQSEWKNKGAKGKKLLVPHNALWLEKEEVTLAELLKPAGYTSCFVGKWHLGADEWYPTQQGFDYNFGGCDYGQPPSYFDPYNQPKGRHEHLRAGIPGLPGRKAGEYLSDREADEAVQFIEKHKDQPFFLMVANYAVHTPIQAKDDVTAKYEAKPKGRQSNAKYAAMVESVDDSMGKIMKTLDKLNLTENTLIIFTSDNGGLDKPTNNDPLRSGKGYPYEGGVRVPFIVKWPSKIKSGMVSDTPVISMDIFPTFANAAGAALPKDKHIDGLDIIKIIDKSEKRKTLYWHFPHYRHAPGPYSIIRDGHWKLIKWYEGPVSLFNLKEDLAEQNDLATKMPEKVKELEKKIKAHLSKTTDRIPVPNPDYVAK